MSVRISVFFKFQQALGGGAQILSGVNDKKYYII